MRDQENDYVSMHHRIRRKLRKRLKHFSTENETPVTDIVNQAIEDMLSRRNWGEGSHSDVILGTPRDLLQLLKDACLAGDYYEVASKCKKNNLLQVAQIVGISIDARASGDRLVSLIKSMIDAYPPNILE